MRRRVLLAFEQAEREQDRAAQRRLLTFVVVGGGPTGVELAGALAEISRHALANDFRAIDPESARVILIEGGPAVLADLSRGPLGVRPARARAAGCRRVDRQRRDGRRGPARSTSETRRSRPARFLWAAGVSASPLGPSLGVPLDRAGRVLVQDDLTIPGHPEVCVVGDLAAFKGERRQLAARRGAGGHAAGRARRRERATGASAGQPHDAVRVPQPRQHGDHRPQLGRGRHAALQDEGIPPGCSGCSCTSSS